MSKQGKKQKEKLEKKKITTITRQSNVRQPEVTNKNDKVYGSWQTFSVSVLSSLLSEDLTPNPSFQFQLSVSA